MKKRALCCFAALTVLAGLLAGCRHVTPEQETQTTIGTTEALPEDILISTAYGDLHYPDQWREYLQVQQSTEGDELTACFTASFDGKAYVLFNVIIGNKEGDVVGKITDAQGTVRDVAIRVPEISMEGLSEDEQNRIYAMQDELNYLIDHLK